MSPRQKAIQMATPHETWVMQLVAQAKDEMAAQINANAHGMRRAMAEKQAKMEQSLIALGAIAQNLEVHRSGAGIVRIEDLPGKREPYDFLVDIPIGSGSTSQREGSFSVSQEGPFVAVRRYATFQSALEFSVVVNSATSRFTGRSFGRYRPIHSAWDLNDAQSGVTTTFAHPIPASMTMVGAVELPSAMSGFRTMEFDGRILVEDAGSGRPRQNISVPSSLWTPQINSPQDLGALDFFERGSVVTFKVQPNHVNNPPAGNAAGDLLFSGAAIPLTPADSWPFLAGQYDKHEGIITPGAFSSNAATPPVVTRIEDDVVTRLPDGILTIGFIGYRILQPIGPMG